MNLNGRRRSSNVEDRRGISSGMKIGGGIGAVIIAAILAWISGGDPIGVLTQNAGMLVGNGQSGQQYEATAEDQQLEAFVSQILAGTEDVWSELFRQQGMTYEPRSLFSSTARCRADAEAPRVPSVRSIVRLTIQFISTCPFCAI